MQARLKPTAVELHITLTGDSVLVTAKMSFATTFDAGGLVKLHLQI